MIQCANPLAQYKSHDKEILEAIKRVLDSGNYILGPEVDAFENSFGSYCGVKYAVGVNSGTDALILALKAMGIGHGDEVITVSHTALATVAAIIATGARPVLVDIEPVFYTIDPESFKRAITPRTRAVIPVHLYGQPADMDAVMEIANEHNLFVVEDCAQAAGATYKGKKVGSIGDVGCFSFYPTKNLGSIGDGGAIVTNDAGVGDRVRRLRQYGWDKNRATNEPGFNSRLGEIEAAILNVKLKTLDQDNRQRRLLAHTYNQALGDRPVELPKERLYTSHVYHLYVIGIDKRDILKEKLLAQDIIAGIHYSDPAHNHPGYKKHCIVTDAGLPVTNKVVQKILSLPMYPEITVDQVVKISGFI